MKQPLDSVVLHGARYHYLVDVEGGCIWLEHVATKQQWQWRSAQPHKNRLVLKGKRLPEGACVTAVLDFFRMGECLGKAIMSVLGEKSPVYVELKQSDDGNVTVRVELALAWHGAREHETLVLEPIPLQERKRVRTDMEKKHTQLRMDMVMKLMRRSVFVALFALLLLVGGYFCGMVVAMLGLHIN
jgi:hypothetical protein